MSELMCRGVVDRLADLLDGVLVPAERGRVDAHLAICPRCVEFIASYRTAGRLVREATEAAMPPASRDALRRRLGLV